MTDTVFKKYASLKNSLKRFERVGIAFSGGIDSSLLLLAAGETLGREKVTALHGRSLLTRGEADIEALFRENFTARAKLEIVELDPLGWPDFVNNDDRRCYHCKKRTYAYFLEKLAHAGGGVLLDGTNQDDLAEERPGLAVLQELGVATPLVDAGLGKKDIRFLSRAFGLPHHDKPSNSCLATRLQYLPRVEVEALERVAAIESLLKKMGFSGCRVRPFHESAMIEVRNQDFLLITQKHNRIQIREHCARYGFKKVYLDLAGR